MTWVYEVPPLCLLQIERYLHLASSTLLCSLPVTFVGYKVLEGRQQTCAKSATLTVEVVNIVLFQNTNKKLLREILRVLDSCAPAPRESIQRIPISGAEVRQGISCFCCGLLPRGNDQAPPGHRELTVRPHGI